VNTTPTTDDADFARAIAAAKRLGIRFDSTAVWNMQATWMASQILPARPVPRGAEAGAGSHGKAFLSGHDRSLRNTVPGLSREAQHQSCVDTLKRGAELIDGKQIDGQPMRLLLECNHVGEAPKCFLTAAAEGIEIVRASTTRRCSFSMTFTTNKWASET